jgi:hypothetical protein
MLLAVCALTTAVPVGSGCAVTGRVAPDAGYDEGVVGRVAPDGGYDAMQPPCDACGIATSDSGYDAPLADDSGEDGPVGRVAPDSGYDGATNDP